LFPFQSLIDGADGALDQTLEVSQAFRVVLGQLKDKCLRVELARTPLSQRI
jgi:hypothetical protein